MEQQNITGGCQECHGSSEEKKLVNNAPASGNTHLPRGTPRLDLSWLNVHAGAFVSPTTSLLMSLKLEKKKVETLVKLKALPVEKSIQNQTSCEFSWQRVKGRALIVL